MQFHYDLAVLEYQDEDVTVDETQITERCFSNDLGAEGDIDEYAEELETERKHSL